MRLAKLILILWIIVAILATARVAYGEAGIVTVDLVTEKISYEGDELSTKCLATVDEIIKTCEDVLDEVNALSVQCNEDYSALVEKCKESTGAVDIGGPSWLGAILMMIGVGLLGAGL